jgi:hypothetical protein
MSADEEGFLRRWARRKAAATEAAATENAPAAETTRLTEEVSQPHARDESRTRDALREVAGASALPEGERAPDLTALPSIDSIEAATDVRAFLARGVPADLARAALRRAFAADPAIRDFVGPAENAWDFNSPGAIYGFDPALPATGENVLAALQQHGPPQAETVPAAGKPVPTADEEGSRPADGGELATGEGVEPAEAPLDPKAHDGSAHSDPRLPPATPADSAPQREGPGGPSRSRRTHGGALPR